VKAESYLEHAAWVRQLAHALVFDSSQVDDVVQQTWLELLRRPPQDDRNPRGWLATVARNAARQIGRSESRRQEREQRAADRPVPAG